ncbi:MAG TPA: TetR/AcrR family transcriptional regulator [Pseudomonadales bacterium]|nr:TetR/AcrR family transcriptional regulator [Pseudomonadales bacterium]
MLERRERFMEAGFEVFGSIGLRKATVKMLCKSAGLTERYFYESFTDTEDLFCAVYNKQTEALREFFVAELPRLPAELSDRIPQVLSLFFDVMKDERVVRILHVESMAGSARVSQEHFKNLDLYADVAAYLIRMDNPNLNVSHDFARGLGIAINGACSALAVQWMIGGYKVPQQTVVDSCALIVRGAMHELRAFGAGQD